ncbi:ABC transporter permease [Natronosalvus halobius]|uniref:ABC transporter permease n=1 Tax=Natronosalvus halobius TaxID=2953746 RepID=UPI0020A15A9D|nr:ABC transporter permease [Natronosalvus halobius]USZ72755.1 ABC transporter permease [Natronosalvus halobius]
MSRELRAGEDDSTLHARLAIVRREWRSLRSEKTIVLALAIQLVIAGFSGFLVVGLVSLYDPGAVEGQEMTVALTGDDRDALLEAVHHREAIEPRLYDDRGAAYADFDRRAVAAVVETNRLDDGRLAIVVTAPDEGIGTTLLISELQETFRTVEFEERQANADRLESPPLSVPSTSATPYFGFTYTILVPLLLFLPVFISGSIAVDSLIEERQRGTLELLRVAPLSFPDVIDAKLVATASLAPLQGLAWLLLLAFNGTAIANPAALIVFVAALALLIVALGMGVALYAPDRRQAQLLYSAGIVGLLVVTSLLPEHPANTVAKLAIGSETTTTWLLFAGYVVAGLGAYLLLQWGLERVDQAAL